MNLLDERTAERTTERINERLDEMSGAARGSLTEDQVMYLRDVLGVRDILIPQGAALGEAQDFATHLASQTRILGDPNSAKLVVMIASASEKLPLEGPVEDLTSKMVQAMKVLAQQVAWVEWTHLGQVEVPAEVRNVLETVGSCPVLVFGADTLSALIGEEQSVGEWAQMKGSAGMVNLLATLRPEELLENSELKRVAWVHLQKLMQKIVST